MADLSPKSDLLSANLSYSGAGISVRTLEETIGTERQRQREQIEEISSVRQRNSDLQGALDEEIGKLRDLSKHLGRARGQSGFGARLREILAQIPGFKGRIMTRRSVEALLRQQYEVSSERLKEAAELADRLDGAKTELFDEIERLNDRIVEAARNEETAADHVLEVQQLLGDLEHRRIEVEPGSVQDRELSAQIDRARRRINEHSGLLKLYDTAQERLERLKDNTRNLADTIAQLHIDITLYVTAAGEKLDLIAGQIQAIGAAADASLVMLELKSTLDSLTESVNHTTRFVSETQAYFRDNVDRLVDELALYDQETERVLASNLASSQLDAEMDVAEAISTALAKKQRLAGAKGEPAR